MLPPRFFFRTGELRFALTRQCNGAYHYGMHGVSRWTLVFTPSSVEHLAERDIDADDVADAVFGTYGRVRVRRGGRAEHTRWFIVAPLAGGEFITCVLRAAEPRDMETEGVFIVPTPGSPAEPAQFSESMRVCVSARSLMKPNVGGGRNTRLPRMAARKRRSLMKPKVKRLPVFRTDREEREFWARRSVEEFAGELEDLDVAIRPPRSEQIALRLYKDDLDSLKALAKRRGVGYTTLARSIVEQWVSRARSKPGGRARRVRQAS